MEADGDQKYAHVATAVTPIDVLCSNIPMLENLFQLRLKLGKAN